MSDKHLGFTYFPPKKLKVIILKIHCEKVVKNDFCNSSCSKHFFLWFWKKFIHEFEWMGDRIDRKYLENKTLNLVLPSDRSNTILSNIERTRTSFFEHRMNLNVFIYGWSNSNTLFLALIKWTSNNEPNKPY